MIRRLVEALGRREFSPTAEYGPWEFGRHVTVYVGRRWSWLGKKRSVMGETWFAEMPVQWKRLLGRDDRTSVLKIEVGPLLICWDRHIEYVTSRMWEADRPGVDLPTWRGWRS